MTIPCPVSGEHFRSGGFDFYKQNRKPPVPPSVQLTKDPATGVRSTCGTAGSGGGHPGDDDLAKSPLLSAHWLNTGFYHSIRRKTKQPLLGYLNRNAPICRVSRSFLALEDVGGTPKTGFPDATIWEDKVRGASTCAI